MEKICGFLYLALDKRTLKKYFGGIWHLDFCTHSNTEWIWGWDISENKNKGTKLEYKVHQIYKYWNPGCTIPLILERQRMNLWWHLKQRWRELKRISKNFACRRPRFNLQNCMGPQNCGECHRIGSNPWAEPGTVPTPPPTETTNKLWTK